MKTKKKKRTGGIFLALGIICILAALGLFGYNMWDAYRADQAEQGVLAKFPESKQVDEKDLSQLYPDREMPTIEIDGYRYIGTLSIPSEKLELPVMEEWDYTRLKIAPCRYSGTVYQDNLIIAGHNYYRHFSRLKWISIGEKVDFTDVEGNVYHYLITNKETLKPTMVNELIEDENDQWDLTLFTCNTGGQTRCIIRCERIDEEEKDE